MWECRSSPVRYISAPGVLPSASITWFQAQQACANVGKQLLTNAEWQLAAAGTPDDTSCNISSGTYLPTGSLPNCVSNWGAFDMVGNLWEWVADWIQTNTDVDSGNISTSLYGFDGIFGIDEANPFADQLPAAIQRGNSSFGSAEAGVFSLNATSSPSFTGDPRGFRCGE